MKASSGIILADQQFPNDNPVLLNQVEKYMASKRWDFLVYLGDGLDMDAISHHAFEAGDRRSMEGKRLKKDYEAYAKILRRHRKIVGPKCKIIYFMGNHEEWADRLVDMMPGLEELIEPRYCLPFDELAIEVVDYRMARRIGPLTFIHGDQDKGRYVSVTHAKKYVESWHRPLVYGDKHTIQAFTNVSPVAINEKYTAYAVPCLADIRPKWNRDKPNAWVNGFATFHVTQKRYVLNIIPAIDNGFISPEGNLFEA